MNSKKITFGLLVVYFMALIWIVLFKCSISIAELPNLRSINLIPFAGSVIVNGKTNFNEIIGNVVVFIPFGILIHTLWQEKNVIQRIAPVFGVSLLIEALQFVFSVGASDITDLIMNTAGGIMGIFIAVLFQGFFKRRYVKVINIMSFVSAIFLVFFIGGLIAANR
jgi:glycopeptide antibiotics resistance protein